jgi:hypothetical protein
VAGFLDATDFFAAGAAAGLELFTGAEAFLATGLVATFFAAGLAVAFFATGLAAVFVTIGLATDCFVTAFLGAGFTGFLAGAAFFTGFAAGAFLAAGFFAVGFTAFFWVAIVLAFFNFYYNINVIHFYVHPLC